MEETEREELAMNEASRDKMRNLLKEISEKFEHGDTLAINYRKKGEEENVMMVSGSGADMLSTAAQLIIQVSHGQPSSMETLKKVAAMLAFHDLQNVLKGKG